MTLKVLHIASDDLWGGAEAQIELILKSFKDRFNKEIEFSLLTFNDGNLSKKSKLFSSNIFLANEKNGIIQVIQNSLKIAKLTNPKIVVSHGYKEAIIACILKLIYKYSWVHQVHGSSENYKGIKNLKLQIYSLIEKNLARYFADKIIFVSRATRKYFGFENRKNSLIIYNSAESVMIKDDNNPVFKIAVIGRIAPIKRIDIAIETFNAFQISYPIRAENSELHIIGDGPLLNSMKEKVNQSIALKNKIIFHGFKNDISNTLKDFSLILLTSDNEGIPTIILEAAHAKIPVLAREVGGISEIKENIPSYPIKLTKSSNPIDIAEEIAKIYAQHIELLEIAKKTNTDFFLPTRCATEHFNLYKSL